MSSDENIFNLAARQSQLKKKKQTDSHSEQQIVKSQSEEKLSSVTNHDAQEMLKRMHELKSNLTEKFDEVIDLSGLSPTMLKPYLDIIFRFLPPETKKEMMQPELQLEEKVWTSLGVQKKIAAKEHQQRKLSKGRKAKSVGARRRWIETK